MMGNGIYFVYSRLSVRADGYSCMVFPRHEDAAIEVMQRTDRTKGEKLWRTIPTASLKI